MKHLEIKHLAPYLPYQINTDKGLLTLLEGDYCECKQAMLATRYICEAIKPELRKISDITEIERKQLFNLVFGRAFPDNGGQVFIDKKPSRWVLSSGLDRLGIQENGEVWYDCDLSPYKFNQHLVTLFFLEKHFDLFGLIEDGLATEVSKQISI